MKKTTCTKCGEECRQRTVYQGYKPVVSDKPFCGGCTTKDVIAAMKSEPKVADVYVQCERMK